MSGLSRRAFLFATATASGALLLSWKLARAQQTLPYLGARDEAQALGEFVRIEANGDVIIGARGCEIGQGVKTSLPMLIAEELDADWNRVHVEQLPYGYIETDKGPSNRYGGQGAGGSDNIPSGWKDLREAGAVARWLLVQAAAARWNIPAAQLRTQSGTVIGPESRRLGYGELAADAAALDLPKDPVPLKTPDQFSIIGKPRNAELHNPPVRTSAPTVGRGRSSQRPSIQKKPADSPKHSQAIAAISPTSPLSFRSCRVNSVSAGKETWKMKLLITAGVFTGMRLK